LSANTLFWLVESAAGLLDLLTVRQSCNPEVVYSDNEGCNTIRDIRLNKSPSFTTKLSVTLGEVITEEHCYKSQAPTLEILKATFLDRKNLVVNAHNQL